MSLFSWSERAIWEVYGQNSQLMLETCLCRVDANVEYKCVKPLDTEELFIKLKSVLTKFNTQTSNPGCFCVSDLFVRVISCLCLTFCKTLLIISIRMNADVLKSNKTFSITRALFLLSQ